MSRLPVDVFYLNLLRDVALLKKNKEKKEVDNVNTQPGPNLVVK